MLYGEFNNILGEDINEICDDDPMDRNKDEDGEPQHQLMNTDGNVV